MQLYLIRFLNVPPARVPGEGGDKLDDIARPTTRVSTLGAAILFPPA
jgi:hypothetical protein